VLCATGSEKPAASGASELAWRCGLFGRRRARFRLADGIRGRAKRSWIACPRGLSDGTRAWSPGLARSQQVLRDKHTSRHLRSTYWARLSVRGRLDLPPSRERGQGEEGPASHLEPWQGVFLRPRATDGRMGRADFTPAERPAGGGGRASVQPWVPCRPGPTCARSSLVFRRPRPPFPLLLSPLKANQRAQESALAKVADRRQAMVFGLVDVALQ